MPVRVSFARTLYVEDDGGIGVLGGVRSQPAGCFSRSAIRPRMLGLGKPRGSILSADHSRCPITDLSPHSCTRQIAALTRSIASSCASGHGSWPSPRLTHSKP